MAKLIIKKTKEHGRGNPELHKSNDNVVMNSSAMWYGPAKSGKTRLLTSNFNGTDYVFLDFDNNYESVASVIRDNGGKYVTGSNAYDALNQLLDGDITDTVVIIDALSDVRGYMLNYVIDKLDEEYLKHKEGSKEFLELEARVEELQNCKQGIGINQTDTTTWFTNTVLIMLNNSNSINFIHHTTENNGKSKMEGNQGAWTAKFDITYKIEKSGDESYFVRTHQRDCIAKEVVGATKDLEDMVRYTLLLLPEGKNSFTGSELKDIQGLRKDRLPRWVDRSKVLAELFTITKDGRSTKYKLTAEYITVTTENKIEEGK